MRDKISRLEALLNQLTLRLNAAEDQNATLKNRLRVLDAAVDKLRGVEAEAKDLRDWKKDVAAKLKKIAVKIERELR